MISKNWQKKTCVGVFKKDVIKKTLKTIFKKRLRHRWFPVNFEKFLKTPFLLDTWWLLLASMALWLRKYDGFLIFLCLFGWGPFILIQHPTSFWGNGPCECGNKTFWLDTWPRDWCFTWLCRWSPFILSDHPTVWGPQTLWKWKNNVFYVSRDHDIDVSRDCMGGVP